VRRAQRKPEAWDKGPGSDGSVLHGQSEASRCGIRCGAHLATRHGLTQLPKRTRFILQA
jgi:hypothetical protein